MIDKAGPGPTVWARAGEVLSVLGPPATVLSALLVYFGWARSNKQAEVMGLDVNLFGYTSRDYALLSIGALYMPLLCLLLIALLWIWLDGVLRHRIEAAPALAPPVRVLLAVAVALATTILQLLILTVFAPMAGEEYFPYFLALGLLLAAWVVRLFRWTGPPREQANTSIPLHTVEAALVFGLVTLLLFWGTTGFAEIRGRELAQRLEANAAQLPRALLYSPQPLHIGVESVTEVEMGTATEPLYRYDGLRLLTVSGGRYFFLHDEWTVQDSRVVVLPDDSSVRVEYGH